MFYHFWQKFENSKWPPFLERGNFFENCQEYIPNILCGSKISTKLLYLARLRRYKQFCVFPFLEKIRKWPPFLGRGNFFENCQEYIPLIPWGSKISTKSLYLTRLRRYKQFCVFPFLAKKSKIQNGRHFWGGENFLKIAKSTLLRNSMGRKF